MNQKSRVVSFVDGLNLYHAIEGLRVPHLQWLDLRLLSKVTKDHLERALLDDIVCDAAKIISVKRPAAFAVSVQR